MVNERKKKMLKEVKAQISQYPVVGILNIHKLPGRQLHQIRNKLRGEAVIRTVKKKILLMALESSDNPGLKELKGNVCNEVALLLSNTSPFKLARTIEKSKSPAMARPGDIAPQDIVIKAGPTPLPPGPAIGDLQKIKLPAGVQGDKIHIMKDTIVAKKGEEISANVANVLSKLNIEPMEIGLNVVAALEENVIYPNEILFVPLEVYQTQVIDAVSAAFNLSININHFTSETISFIISKAAGEARSLAMEAGILTPDTVGALFSRAMAQADILSGLVKDAVPEKTEEKPAEKTEEPSGREKG